MQRAPWCSTFFCILLLTAAGWGQQILPFGSGFAPSFAFTEDYTESGAYSDEEQDFVDTTSYTLEITAKASMSGIDPATFANNSQELSIRIGNLDLELPFIEGKRSTDSGSSVIQWTLDGLDPDTFDDLPRAGTAELRYDGAKLTLTLSLTKDWDDYGITATDQAGAVGALSFPLLVDFTVGNYGFSGRTAYVQGTAELYDLKVTHGADQMVFTGLGRVRLTGEIDSTAPTVQITGPAVRQTVPTVTVSGIATDDHALQTVLLKVNTDDFRPAVLGNDGSWFVADVTLKPGDNTLVARAIDAEGNTADSGLLTVRYVLLSNLTVSGAGDGSGKISADFFGEIQYLPGQPSPVQTTLHEAGEILAVIAEPGPDAVFAGWTSNYPLGTTQAASPRLTFIMQPDMALTANFLRNPFILARGRYTGLIESDDPQDRGVLTGRLSAKGAFTLVARIGKTTLPIKGRFSGSGDFQTVVVAGLQAYGIELHLDLSVEGQRQITGSITGRSIDATITADLSTFSKKLNPVPPVLVGDYNVLLPPDPGNSDANFPAGIGFARLHVTSSGRGSLNGRLGDGTPVNASGTVAGEPGHDAKYFSFFAALYGRKGSLLGRFTLDVDHPDADIFGELEWYKPPGAAPHDLYPEGFEGTLDLSGSQFIKGGGVPAGLVQASGGFAQFILKAPASGFLPALDENAVCLIETDGTVLVPGSGAIAAAELMIDPKTGLLTGSILEGAISRPVIGLAVPRKLNRVGGFFQRGTRTGSIDIIPQTIPGQ